MVWGADAYVGAVRVRGTVCRGRMDDDAGAYGEIWNLRSGVGGEVVFRGAREAGRVVRVVYVLDRTVEVVILVLVLVESNSLCSIQRVWNLCCSFFAGVLCRL